VRDWVSLQVSHDPAQGWVLVSAVLVLVGLLLSLTVRRRRFWVRLTPRGDGATRVELGGLARTDRAGYGEEFDRLQAALLEREGVEMPVGRAGARAGCLDPLSDERPPEDSP